MGKGKYDTTALLKMIDRYGKRKDFTEAVTEITQTNQSTFTTKVYGHARFNTEELSAMALVLGLKDKDAVRKVLDKDGYTEEEKEAAETAEKATVDEQKKGRSEGYAVNVSVLLKAEKEKGLSRHRVETDASLTRGAHIQWERGRKIRLSTAEKIASVLDLELSSFLIGYKDDTDVRPSNKKPKFPKKQKKMVPTDGILNVFDVFRIINGNLQTIYDEISEQGFQAGQQLECLAPIMQGISVISDGLTDITKRMDALQEQMTGMQKEMEAIKGQKAAVAKQESIKPAPVPTKTPREERENPQVVPGDPLRLEYDPKDNASTYAKKIDTFVKTIAKKRELTANQIRHDFYNELNRTYGVVYEQLQKEYYRKHGKRQDWTLALIHDNSMFAQIYFNLVKNKYIEIQKTSVSR